MANKSIYIVAAYDEESERIAELRAFRRFEDARQIQGEFGKTYGNRNVALASRQIDDVPYLVRIKRVLRPLLSKLKEQSNGR